MTLFLLLLCVLTPTLKAQDDFFYGTFPADFIWDSATSAYQIEGAWNLNGKGESIWDFQAHSADSGIRDNATGDVASDSYHRYIEDVASLAQMGVTFYRFSFSWSRLLPTGHADLVNQDGDEFQGWLADDIVEAFGNYANLGWFAHPIFSATEDYPSEMKEAVARHSTEEGLSESRLPEFDAAWISYIKGTSDFFGLNHYTTGLCEYSVGGDIPSFVRDQDNTQSLDPSWPESEASPWIKVVPWGFRKLLNWIKDEYNNPRLIVTENGFADYGELNDAGRVEYYRLYVDELLKAVLLDGCDVFGYTAWSLIDNFEWLQGYADNGFPAPKTP
ncbi:hypothetical protein B566_EDAN016293 [Ephemera danica]|nr:hypothetical protein B566_EDAN016293 [Ephemera danica]